MPTMTLNIHYKAYVRLMEEVEKGERSRVVSAAILTWFVQQDEYYKLKEDVENEDTD